MSAVPIHAATSSDAIRLELEEVLKLQRAAYFAHPYPTFAERKALYIATHYNHAREITLTSTEAIKRLRLCGATINNQAVLLRGVNDDPTVLAALMRAFWPGPLTVIVPRRSGMANAAAGRPNILNR